MTVKNKYFLVKLFFSKGDIYSIEKIVSFDTKASAIKFKDEIKDPNIGPRWPDWYQYEVLILRNANYYHLNGDKVKTVFD